MKYCQDKTTNENYYKKINELKVYIDPLKELFYQLEYKERAKVKKVEKLLEILSNTNKVCVSYETLLKCEKVLVSESGIFSSALPFDRGSITPSRGKV